MKQENVLVLTKSSLEQFDLARVLFFGDDNNYQTFCYLLGESQYMNREDVEDDLRYVQVIPYVVFAKRDSGELKILVYNRGSKAGEKRLADKWSIGVGGHINPEDGIRNEFRDFEVVTTAAQRELEEELVGLDAQDLRSLVPHGIFYSDTTKVNAVHLGVFFLAIGDNNSFHSMGDSIQEYRWCTVDELKKIKLEDWSAIVLNEFLPTVLT